MYREFYIFCAVAAISKLAWANSPHVPMGDTEESPPDEPTAAPAETSYPFYIPPMPGPFSRWGLGMMDARWGVQSSAWWIQKLQRACKGLINGGQPMLMVEETQVQELMESCQELLYSGAGPSQRLVHFFLTRPRLMHQLQMQDGEF